VSRVCAFFGGHRAHSKKLLRQHSSRRTQSAQEEKSKKLTLTSEARRSAQLKERGQQILFHFLPRENKLIGFDQKGRALEERRLLGNGW